MNQRIVWQLPDGSIRITVPADPRRSLDQVAARTQATVPALDGAVRLPDRDAAELPARRFRACWRADADGRVGVDLALARAQRLAELRSERDERLRASDAPAAEAVLSGDAGAMARLRDYRQALRDLPAALEREGMLERIEAAQALADYTPAWPALPEVR